MPLSPATTPDAACPARQSVSRVGEWVFRIVFFTLFVFLGLMLSPATGSDNSAAMAWMEELSVTGNRTDSAAPGVNSFQLR